VPGVIILKSIRIVKDLCGLSEADAMLLQIADGLFIVPLESH
jgi:hypothetical protein